MIKTEIQEKKSLSHVSEKCYLNREWTHMSDKFLHFVFAKLRMLYAFLLPCFSHHVCIVCIFLILIFY